MLDIVKKASNTLNNMGGENLLKLRKMSPQILVVGGVIGLVVAGIGACVQTTKLEDIVDEAKEEIDDVKNGDVYEDNPKELTKTYLKTAGKVVKLYAGPIIVGAASIGMILGSNRILNKRNAAVAAAYALTSDEFKAYRQRVVSELGLDADRRFKFGLSSEEITETIKDEETGKKKKVKKTVNIINSSNYSQYAKVFDDASRYWSPNPETNLMFLKTQQSYFNDMLRSRENHTVFLNEVYEALDIPITQTGQVVGWHLDNEDGDGFIDFGIYNIKDETKRDFINGRENVIFLDFNVDGVVWDLI